MTDSLRVFFPHDSPTRVYTHTWKFMTYRWVIYMNRKKTLNKKCRQYIVYWSCSIYRVFNCFEFRFTFNSNLWHFSFWIFWICPLNAIISMIYMHFDEESQVGLILVEMLEFPKRPPWTCTLFEEKNRFQIFIDYSTRYLSEIQTWNITLFTFIEIIYKNRNCFWITCVWGCGDYFVIQLEWKPQIGCCKNKNKNTWRTVYLRKR